MLKRTALTLGYYIISFTLFFLLNDAYPSDMCNPGMGMYVLILMIPLSIGLLIRNMYVTHKVGRSNLPATLIHVAACAVILVPFVFY
jgi:hypothetical protein